VLTLSSREKLLKILVSLRNRIASPSDIIAATGLPRYEVLAAFHILEALDFVEPVYIRGNYKLYRLTNEGEKIVDALNSGRKFKIEIKPIEGSIDNVKQVEVGVPSTISNTEMTSEAS